MAKLHEKEVYVTRDGDVERNSDEKVNRRRSSLGGVISGDTNAIEGQLFSMNDIDPALDAKMRLVNNVSIECSYSKSLLTGHRLSIKSAGPISI